MPPGEAGTAGLWNTPGVTTAEGEPTNPREKMRISPGERIPVVNWRTSHLLPKCPGLRGLVLHQIPGAQHLNMCRAGDRTDSEGLAIKSHQLWYHT